MNRPTEPPDNGGGVPPPRNSNPADEGARASLAVDESTGLPGLRSWRAVYTVVIGLFVVWVGLLTWLTAYYS
jgi:hypothetical protein